MVGKRLEMALVKYRERYQSSDRRGRSAVLDVFCSDTGYHRKYAIVLLGEPADSPMSSPRRRRGVTYSPAAVRVLQRIWEAADYPWSVRLRALLPLWLPWARTGDPECTPDVEAQLLRMSARQMDRRLGDIKRTLKRRMYGRTKPGSLLKQDIPVKTDNWDVNEPGHCEIDLVSHSGACASGEFIYSLNVTDIHTGWSETYAIMGKGETGVVSALDEIRRALPFVLKAIDSDNGSEFINHHLVRYCHTHTIQFTRGRPYKKDDNAHIEQKNWTHVRRILGWDRYDTRAQLEAINALYRGPLRIMMNCFQPSVKLERKVRVGSRYQRHHDDPQTPLDRLAASSPDDPVIGGYLSSRTQTNPFELATVVERHLIALKGGSNGMHNIKTRTY